MKGLRREIDSSSCRQNSSGKNTSGATGKLGGVISTMHLECECSLQIAHVWSPKDSSHKKQLPVARLTRPLWCAEVAVAVRPEATTE